MTKILGDGGVDVLSLLFLLLLTGLIQRWMTQDKIAYTHNLQTIKTENKRMGKAIKLEGKRISCQVKAGSRDHQDVRKKRSVCVYACM